MIGGQEPVFCYTTASHEPVIETWDITEAVDKAVEAVELCGSLYFGLKEVLLFLKKGQLHVDSKHQ